jgi:hypothetical protein
MHYPSTVAISDAEGEAIANYINANSMQLLRRVQIATRRQEGIVSGRWIRNSRKLAALPQ